MNWPPDPLSFDFILIWTVLLCASRLKVIFFLQDRSQNGIEDGWLRDREIGVRINADDDIVKSMYCNSVGIDSKYLRKDWLLIKGSFLAKDIQHSKCHRQDVGFCLVELSPLALWTPFDQSQTLYLAAGGNFSIRVLSDWDMNSIRTVSVTSQSQTQSTLFLSQPENTVIPSFPKNPPQTDIFCLWRIESKTATCWDRDGDGQW